MRARLMFDRTGASCRTRRHRHTTIEWDETPQGVADCHTRENWGRRVFRRFSRIAAGTRVAKHAPSAAAQIADQST